MKFDPDKPYSVGSETLEDGTPRRWFTQGGIKFDPATGDPLPGEDIPTAPPPPPKETKEPEYGKPMPSLAERAPSATRRSGRTRKE